MTKIKVGNALLCEFIAEGVNGKHTLVNAYSGDILMKDMPAAIPIAFYIEIIPDTTKSTDVELRVMLGNKTIAIAGATMDFNAGEMCLIAIPTSIINIEKNSVLKVTMSAEDIKPLTLISRSINKGTRPTSPTA